MSLTAHEDRAIEELTDSPFILDVRRQVDSISGRKVFVLSYLSSYSF